MNNLVRLFTTQDGDIIDEPLWHLTTLFANSIVALCSQECFGLADSTCEYEVKSVNRGGLTCPDCIVIIKEIKAVKL